MHPLGNLSRSNSMSYHKRYVKVRKVIRPLVIRWLAEENITWILQDSGIKSLIGPQKMLTFVAQMGYYFYGGDNYGKNINSESKD